MNFPLNRSRLFILLCHSLNINKSKSLLKRLIHFIRDYGIFIIIILLLFNWIHYQCIPPTPVIHNCAKLPFAVLQKWPRKLNTNIPKLVHYIYRNDQIPQKYASLIRNCIALNDDYHFILWTDYDINRFLRPLLNLHDKKLLDSYQGIKKSDIIRLLILHRIGGIYMDMDMECKKSLNNFFHFYNHSSSLQCLFDREVPIQTQILYNREFAVMNNFIICKSKHPFVRYVLDNTQLEDNKTSIMNATGPLFLTRVYQQYQTENLSNTTINNNDQALNPLLNREITLASSDLFSPMVDNVDYLEEICVDKKPYENWVNIGCSNIGEYRKEIDKKYKDAFLVHRFFHLGYERFRSQLKYFENACEFSNLYRVIH